MTQKRVSGFVMAKEHDGTIKVRVRHPNHSLDGHKLVVRQVRSGMDLQKGDEVDFHVIDADEDRPKAVDVCLRSVSQRKCDTSVTQELGEMVSILITKSRCQGLGAFLTSHTSREEAEKDINTSGSDEKVVALIRVNDNEAVLSAIPFLTNGEQAQAGFVALTNLLYVEPIRDAFELILNRVVDEVAASLPNREKQ